MSKRDKIVSTNNRAREAWGLRQSGMTYKAIGEALGCSVQRARQLAVKHGRFADLYKSGTVHELPTRAQNALWNEFCMLDPDCEAWPLTPHFVAENTDYLTLCRVPNLGDTSIKAIANWLEEYGETLRGYGKTESPQENSDGPRCKCCGQLLPVDAGESRR